MHSSQRKALSRCQRKIPRSIPSLFLSHSTVTVMGEMGWEQNVTDGMGSGGGRMEAGNVTSFSGKPMLSAPKFLNENPMHSRESNVFFFHRYNWLEILQSVRKIQVACCVRFVAVVCVVAATALCCCCCCCFVLVVACCLFVLLLLLCVVCCLFVLLLCVVCCLFVLLLCVVCCLFVLLLCVVCCLFVLLLLLCVICCRCVVAAVALCCLLLLFALLLLLLCVVCCCCFR